MIRKLSFSLIFFLIFVTSLSQKNELIINNIHITGNRTTKDYIILRELTFKKGDTISAINLEQHIIRSRENVLNTSLFNYVTVTTENTGSNALDMNIHVEERWYTWPSVILKYDDRNFSAWLKSKDLSRSKYGFSIDRFNCFGRKETLKFSILFGYAKQVSVSYKNIAIDKNRKHLIGGEIEITKQDEIIFKTAYNEPLAFRNSFSPVFGKNKYTLNYIYRPYINDLHNFYLNYLGYSVADTIIKLNPDYLINNKNHLECITFDYVYSKDKRDIKAYPLKGSYFELLVGQTVSLPFSKASFLSTVFIPSFYKYIEINKRFYYVTGINLKLSYNNNYSYLYSKSIGYIYNMHGFEYNTIEGQHFIIIKNLFKTAVMKPRISEISFIPIHKFNKIHYALYFNVFTDCGYVADKYGSPDNSFANKFLISGGAGFDIVTYYDRTFRAEYSINGFGIGGFYFHLTAPINK
jgi:outer membrane protein assembly factor BamA